MNIMSMDKHYTSMAHTAIMLTTSPYAILSKILAVTILAPVVARKNLKSAMELKV